jgi:hypothetical protein
MGGRLFQFLRAGAGMGALTQFGAMFARGGGGAGNMGSLTRVIKLAQMEGLRGARIDEYLNNISSSVSQMGRQGLRVDVGGLAEFLNRAARTPGLREQGIYTARVAGRMMGAGFGGARQQLLSGFGQVAQSVVLAEAASRGGDIMETLAAIEDLSAGGMTTMRGLLTQYVGRGVAEPTYALYGAPSAQARALAGILEDPGDLRFRAVAQGGIRAGIQQMEAARLSSITEDQVKAVIGAVEGLKNMMFRLGKNGANIVKALQELPKAMEKLKEKARAEHGESGVIFLDMVMGPLKGAASVFGIPLGSGGIAEED